MAVDYDGTLVLPTGEFDETGAEVVRALTETNGVFVLLWTCRTGRSLKAAVRRCRENGIMFDAVNRGNGKRPLSRKVNADFYIDDRATIGKIDWNGIYEEVLKEVEKREWGICEYA